MRLIAGGCCAGYMTKILEVNNLKVRFQVNTGLFVRAAEKYKTVIDGVSFSIDQGETFGIVGETGSGKSTIAKTLVGINIPWDGEIIFLGKRLDLTKKPDLIFLRKNIGIVFQDPVGSLNPKLRVYDIIYEGLNLEEKMTKPEKHERIYEVAKQVGLNENKLNSYPGELSGGEKQRVSLARAIISPKKLLILDEPTSSLDVSIQAQILNLLQKIKKELNLTYIFITHDFNVIKYMCDRLGVLYYGRMLEISPVKQAYENPLHPYTQDLMSANISVENTSGFESQYDIGEPSREGCIYKNSCKYRMEICEKDPPVFQREYRYVKCWLLNEAEQKLRS